MKLRGKKKKPSTEFGSDSEMGENGDKRTKKQKQKAEPRRGGYKGAVDDWGIGHFDDWMDDVLKDKDLFDEKDQNSLKKEQNRLDGESDESDVREGDLEKAVDWVKEGQEERISKPPPQKKKKTEQTKMEQKKTMKDTT